MSNIDYSQLQTPQARAAAAAEAQRAARRAACRGRILAVVSETAQINLAAAAAAGRLSAAETALYRAGLDWIDAMRAAARGGAPWPEAPAGFAALAARF